MKIRKPIPVGFTAKTLLSFLLLAAAWPARAATYTVNTTSDAHSLGFSGSPGAPDSTGVTDSAGQITLRSALEYASTVGGSTTINLPAGTYDLTLGDLVAGSNPNTTIYLHGLASSTNTIIHQTQTHDLVWVVNYNLDDNVIFSLDNVTVSGGNEDSGDPDGFDGNGGAISAGGGSTAPGNVVNLTNVVFSANDCGGPGGGGNGGAIAMDGGGNLNVINCTFNNNSAARLFFGYGGAIYFNNEGNPGSLFIRGCGFSNNVAGLGYGGAVYVASGNLTGNYNRFKGNQAGAGGAVYIAGSADATGDLRNSWWGGNSGPNQTGGDTTFPTTGSTPPLSSGQIAFSPYLQLGHSANPATIFVGNSTTLTAGFLTNSAGAAIAAGNLTALVGLPVGFSGAVGGSIFNPQLSIQSSGTATATFTASAAGLGSANATVDNATAAATIPIDQAPSITSAATATFTVGHAGAFTVTTSGYPAPSLAESGALPAGVSFLGPLRYLGGTPAPGTGRLYPLTFTATSGIGANTQNFTLVVNEAPAITNVSSTTFTVDAPAAFQIGATGFPAPTLNESDTDTLPNGIVFDAATGSLGGTPAAGSGGTYTLHFTAQNGVGAVAAQTFTLTVLGTPFIVYNLADHGPGSLREVIASASSNATIIFTSTLSGQTIQLTNGQIPLNENVSIDASPLSNGVAINGHANGRIFSVGEDVDVLLNSLTLTNGLAAGDVGGAILNGGNLTLSQCTLARNNAGSDGGGIENDGSLALDRCTLSENSAPGGGGAINNNGPLILNQCTLFGNSGNGTGDGVWAGGTLAATNSTVVGNQGDGFTQYDQAPLVIVNSIVAQNAGVNVNGTFTGVSNLITANPLLAPLGNYGGPTPTMPPLYGSPAIDAGLDSVTNSLATDQRGYPRLYGAQVDIGAVELQAAETFYNPVQTVADSGPYSLRGAVAGVPAGSTITFAPALSGQTIQLTNGQIPLNENVSIDASSLSNGVAINGHANGRIFSVGEDVDVLLNSLTLTNGLAAGDVGGAILNGGNLTLSQCTLAGNYAGSDGGGIENDGSLALNTCTLSGNSASGDGGAIGNTGPLTLSQCTLAGNDAGAGSYGGGIENDGSLALDRCTLSENSAPGGGGAINNNGPLILNQCTLFGNSGNGTGDGVWAGGTLAATNSTVVGNQGDGFTQYDQAPLVIVNSIVAQNAGVNVNGTFTGASNLIAAYPLLAPLGNYGGPTPTMPPEPGSPAIDAGLDSVTNSLATDQRGFPRLAGPHVDIGAVEGIFNPAFPITGVTRLGHGAFQFSFNNLSGPSYRVLATTNLAAPFNTWSSLGTAVEAPAGLFQFTDPQATNYPQRFYRVEGP